MEKLKCSRGVVAACLTVVAIASASAYYYASPYIALKKMESAYLARDAAKLSQFIDFPSVRKNVNAQFTKLMDRNLPKEGVKFKNSLIKPGDPEVALGTGMIFNKLINQENLELVLNTISTKSLHQYKKQGTRAKHPYRFTYTTHYDSSNQFRVKFVSVEKGETVSLIFHRDFLNWKLTNVDLSDVLNDNVMRNKLAEVGNAK